MPKTIAEETLALISAHPDKRESTTPADLATPLVSHNSDECTSKKSQDKSNDAQDAANADIDTVEAARHLRLCGIGGMEPVILCAYGTTKKSRHYVAEVGKTTTGSPLENKP